MLNLSCPRSRTSRVIGNGNVVTSCPFTLPVYIAVLARRNPRATVPGSSGRSDRLSRQNVVIESGLYFGWSCISCRQPLRTSIALTAKQFTTQRLLLNFGHPLWIHRLQKISRL